ncbi:phosphatidylethanolamine-binding protein [Apiospora hydei]|uniref:Phosphatidylethanolamine-binding protein n=1 Tax=Apiospora hydei TaxID=1337664 RepID=A0ABR1WYT6_9PEZI
MPTPSAPPLQSAGLVPGPATALLPASTDWRPTTQLHVAFGGEDVELGTFFRAGECKSTKPVVRFGAPASATPLPSAAAAEETTEQQEKKKRNKRRYTFLMIDPDAPTPDDPKFAFWRHWVVTGLSSGGETGGDCADTGNEVTEYLGPGPKDDSKPHRYLFLLYQEPDGMQALTKADVGGDEFVQRRSFDAATFAARQGLVLVGMNWMTCAGDGWSG